MLNRTRLTFVILVVAAFSGGSAFAESEVSKRLRQAEAELKKARASLHMAHEELGKKAEYIRELEGANDARDARLKGKGRRQGTQSEIIKLKRELQLAEARIRALEKKLKEKAESVEAVAKTSVQDKKKPSSKPAEKATPKVESFKVDYDRNSAASFEGRENALKWIKAKIRKTPDVKFAIRGLANDTEYEEANRAIAGNRAGFLASFLRVEGVPPEALAEVTGEESPRKGEAGRVVEIVTIP